jgi:hypothetical protein
MNFEFIEGRETGYKVVKFGGVRISGRENRQLRGRKRWSGCDGGRAWGWKFRSSRVGRGGRQDGAGIRAPIGEDQEQF